ncbi:hypothetical protein SEA_LILYPAD_59 [Gordonia phage LilyPad]|nr:hypothetical protein SEA_LILYPAD_59 [Gordonia phage LilyPad]
MAPTGQAKTFRFGKKVKNGATKEAGIKTYQGPKPPSGSYKCALKQLTIKENRNGDNMLSFVAEIADTGPRAKYNGFAIFGQQNITDQGAGYVNQLLDAISDGDSSVKEEFWEGAVKTKKAEKPDKNGKPVYHVRSIGDFKVGSPDDLDIEIVITGKKGSYGGEYKLDAQGYGPASLDLDGDDEDEDDIEADDEDDDEQLGEVEEDSDDEDSDDDSDDEDEGDVFDDEDEDDEDEDEDDD